VASGFSRTKNPVASGFSRTKNPVASGFSRTKNPVASGFSRTGTRLQSPLSAICGATRTARRVGSTLATNVTVSSIAATTAYITGSAGRN